jgi:hypothetical protein
VHRGYESTKSVVLQQYFVDLRSAPMPTECRPDFFGFEPVEGRAMVAAAITSDAGALLLGRYGPPFLPELPREAVGKK